MTRPLLKRGVWDQVARAIAEGNGARPGQSGRRPLIAFDVDGTLAPIVVDPARAKVPGPTQRLIAALAADSGLVVAVVSARRERDLRRILPVRGLLRVAQYGLEGVIAPSAGTRASWRRKARKVRGLLEPIAAHTPGSWVEDKGMTVSLHDRLVAPRTLTSLRRALRRAAVKAEQFGFSTERGIRVTDFVPRGYDKGHAIEALRRGARGAPVIYFGDSDADEPAFAALGPDDVPVRVGPGRTRARFRARGTADVARFLRRLLELRRASATRR
ncbi:MAG TPA: trehalose-phosphatase [Candidatus Eisenbacteria bacterium]|nr:trehalose-phosphatase [Candidatus Eisenbacteria bacterium]